MLCPNCGRDNPSDAQFCNECGASLDAPVAETPTSSEESAEETAVLTSGSFVGRQREMARLGAALEEALAGQGRLVMLAGEPGIGKIRLTSVTFLNPKGKTLFADSVTWALWRGPIKL